MKFPFSGNIQYRNLGFCTRDEFELVTLEFNPTTVFADVIRESIALRRICKDYYKMAQDIQRNRNS